MILTIKFSGFFMIALAVLTLGCDLEQEVEIELPEYESRYVVECYLEPGQPFSLLLTRSAAYFDPFPTSNNQFLENILVSNAQVSISYDEHEIVLENELRFNPFTRKVFNYASNLIVPENLEAGFRLDILTSDGQSISATTQILPVVPIDSVVIQFNDTDSLARVLTYFTDIPGENNFFRRMLHEGTLKDSPEQDFTSDDRIVEDVIVFGTGYNYAVGDTVINSIFHIDRAYYDFLESVQTAVNANGNPFGQPSPIISNLEGDANALGIFTGLSYDRVRTIVQK